MCQQVFLAWGLVEVSPVHSELGGNPVETQRHERHMCDALIGA